jgi:hypothetical protein
MRVFAIHDATGIILGVVTCPADAPTPVLTVQAGSFTTEIELPNGLDAANLKSAELAKSYRVEVAPRKAALVQRGTNR